MGALRNCSIAAVVAASVAAVGACRIGFDEIQLGTDSSLLVWLPVDDGISNGRVSDASGNGNDAACVSTAICPSANTGRDGLALTAFSDQAPGIEIADAPQWQLDQFTLAAWVRVADAAGSDSIIGKPLGGANLNSYKFVVRDDGPLECGISDGNRFTWVTAPSEFLVDRWTHVACTYDGASLRLYTDGALIAITRGTVAIAYDANPVLVGADRSHGESALELVGQIDDVQVYGEALNEMEVGDLIQ